MTTRIVHTTLALCLATLVAGCQSLPTAPTQTGLDSDGPTTDTPAGIYVPDAKSLDRYLALIGDPSLQRLRIDLEVASAPADAITIRPYTDAPEFAITVELPRDFATDSTVYLEATQWHRGDAAPEFAFVGLRHDGTDDIALSEPGAVSTNGLFPWLKGERPVSFFRTRLQADGTVACIDFGWVTGADSPLLARVDVVNATGRKPETSNCDTVIYDDSDGDID